MLKKVTKLNSDLLELENIRNQLYYDYLIDLSFDEWILILCNESTMFLLQSKVCYDYFKENKNEVLKNISLIYYTTLEADFNGIYRLYQIFNNLYEDTDIISNDMAVNLFNDFIDAFDKGIKYYTECTKLIETVKNNPNTVIDEETFKTSKDALNIGKRRG